MTTERIDQLDSIFDRIAERRSSRDANARNCARDVLDKNLGSALRFAESMVSDEMVLEELYAEMNEQFPKKP